MEWGKNTVLLGRELEKWVNLKGAKSNTWAVIHQSCGRGISGEQAQLCLAEVLESLNTACLLS